MTPAMGLQTLAYADGDTSLTGLVAQPAGRPRAAVLVCPTIMNATEAVRTKALALAGAGYLALIADFYGQQPAGRDEAFALADRLRSVPVLYRQRVLAALDALAAVPEAQGLPLAAIGFCMGGQAALELARDGAPLACVATFHGVLSTDLPAAPGAVTARILVCHGDADPLVPRDQVIAFWEEMDAAGADWHFHAYSGVRHGFTNAAGDDYNASADRQSWAAMLSLFDEVLA